MASCFQNLPGFLSGIHIESEVRNKQLRKCRRAGLQQAFLCAWSKSKVKMRKEKHRKWIHTIAQGAVVLRGY
jgi:hypothetical protein